MHTYVKGGEGNAKKKVKIHLVHKTMYGQCNIVTVCNIIL